MVQYSRGFCFENQIGFVKDKKFIPVKFEKVRFMRLIIGFWKKNPTKCLSADMVLRQAIKDYTNTDDLVKYYRKVGMTDSEFYNVWRQIVKKNRKFQILNQEACQRSEKNRTIAKKNRQMNTLVRECIIVLAMKRQLKRMRKNDYIHRKM